MVTWHFWPNDVKSDSDGHKENTFHNWFPHAVRKPESYHWTAVRLSEQDLSSTACFLFSLNLLEWLSEHMWRNQQCAHGEVLPNITRVTRLLKCDVYVCVRAEWTMTNYAPHGSLWSSSYHLFMEGAQSQPLWCLCGVISDNRPRTNDTLTPPVSSVTVSAQWPCSKQKSTRTAHICAQRNVSSVTPMLLHPEGVRNAVGL